MAPLKLPKLKDAASAGKADSGSCSLLLTEGDSATLFVEAGLPFLEEDKFGVCPLKGMFANVRDNRKAVKSPEVRAIKDMLGLEYDKVYTDVEDLRYGHLVFMIDQDHPGHHIIGLILNMFECLWPSLLEIKGFIQWFVTPIITAYHKQTKEQEFFYTMSEFYEWQSGNKAAYYKIKYHKGLATFNDTEAEQFFMEYQENVWNFEWINKDDNDAIKLAFSGKDAEDTKKKKQWLLEEHQASTTFYPKGTPVRYLDFINNEVRQALLDSVQRVIPSIVDGFIRSQRKVIHSAIENTKIQESDVPVDQFSSVVAQETFYRHGEQNLHGVMIGLAQNFVGSNNINLLLPNGQFGSRDHGRKIHGGGRYVQTSLSPVVPYICHPDDKLILNYLYDGGIYIEPSWFYPIIAMVLVNGAVGIAAGWNTFIPHYNPRDIIANLKLLLDDQEVVPMCAWYKGFSGDIKHTPTGFVTEGEFSEVEDGIIISELPVGKWKVKFEATLKGLQSQKVFKTYTTHHRNTNDVHYDIKMSPAQMKKAKQHAGGLLDKFQLTSKLCTSNMNVIEVNGIIKKFGTAEEILKRFFEIRLECYERRRVALLCKLMKARFILESKIRYVRECHAGTVDLLAGWTQKFDELREKGFNTLPIIEKMANDSVTGEQTVTEEAADQFPRTGYDYLLSFQVGSISTETLDELQEEMDKTINDFDVLSGTSPKQLWARDLDDLTEQLDTLGL